MTTPRTPLTDTERQAILDMQAAGESRNAIARQLGRSPGVVSKVVADAGRTFARGEQVAAATQAKQADNRARRAELESLLLTDAMELRKQLWEPALVYSFGGRDNTYEQHVLDRPDAQAQATILRAVGIAIDKSVRLAEVDKHDSGAAEGKGILGQLGAALGMAYGELRAAESAEQDPDGPEGPNHDAEG